MKDLVSNNITIGSKEILCNSKGTKEKILYLNSKSNITFKINGFSYEKESNTMFIQIFLSDEYKNESYGFLNLTLKEIKNEWKITLISRDI